VVDIAKFPQIKAAYTGQGSITLIDYQANELKYNATLTEDAFVVFSEIYYPEGWQATIDDNPVDILRANYILRALEVPAGDHEIVFSFRPKIYSYGNMVTSIGTILLILLVFGTLLVEIGLIKKI